MEFQKNDYLTVTIEDISNEGEGIGKADGFTLFVKDTVIGDVAEVKIMKVKKHYAYARLEKLVKASSYRADPICPTYRQCGGCQLQVLSYENQLLFKQRKVRNNLIRIGGFEETFIDSVMEPVVGMDEPVHYRNKAQYPVGTDKEGNPVAGFYAGRTHNIIPNLDCSLGAAENKQILEIILDYMKQKKVPAYDEMTGKGLIRHVLIRKGFTSGEIMVCLVINFLKGEENRKTGNFLPKQEYLTEKLSEVAGMKSISVSINTERTNVIMGKEIHTIWGEDTISDTIHVRDMQREGYPFTGRELTFHISPLSFYQVNPVQTEKLYSLVLEYAALTGKESVWDLYCGIGTISLFLAGQAGKVYGVEIVPQAILDARENATRNQIENAEFFVGKAEEVLPRFYEKKAAEADVDPGFVTNNMLHPDVIVVDPPRKGCDPACLDTMLKMQPGRIVYVSCDSATLARDLKILCDGGYKIERVRPTDMFGNTVHVETVILLSRTAPDAVIKVNLEMSELDVTSAESKATYKEIQEYVQNKYDLHVTNLYIAQVKQEFGIIERKNYNVGEGKSRVPQVTPEKREAIIDALKYFQMII